MLLLLAVCCLVGVGGCAVCRVRDVCGVGVDGVGVGGWRGD